jgi:hypothetical protein
MHELHGAAICNETASRTQWTTMLNSTLETSATPQTSLAVLKHQDPELLKVYY